LSSDYGESDSAPEALFFDAFSKYKLNEKASFLKEGYEQLLKRYPSSIWAKKALPYRLL
jgi:TolA-binding protein